MNRVSLVGRITKDCEIRVIGERSHTTFFLAINRNYRNSKGEVESDFVLCSAWGKLAERIVQYCGKGSLLGVDGRVQSRSYTNRENKRVFITEIVADDVRFYSLKDPANAANKDSTQHLGTISKAFVLPESEQALPIQP